MRSRVAMALGAALLLTGCGIFGGKSKPDSAASDTSELITKRVGPAMVARCPVPKAYDDATLKRIEQAMEGLPSDSVLRSVMKDYEAERDDLRMCQ